MMLPPSPHAGLHAHYDGDAEHLHFREDTSKRVLTIALVLTVAYAVVEIVAGFRANSLSLLSDAGHMVTDAMSLVLALLAQHVALRPPSPKHSFGFGRAEALAAFVNALLLLLIIGWIGWQAAARIMAPTPVAGETVSVVAGIGIAVNLVIAWVLSRDQKSLNSRAVFLHVLGDLACTAATLVAGLVIAKTGWMIVDPLLSVFASLLLLRSTLELLGQSFHMLMEGVPPEVDYLQVGHDLRSVPGVVDLHDLHIWEMAPGHPALIGHVFVDDLARWPQILSSIQQLLRERHQIDHLTLQPEPADALDHDD